jgi:hypothetical protein
MMTRFLPGVLVFLVSIAWVRSAWPQTPAAQPAIEKSAAGERVVISVGDEKITAAEIENFIQALPPSYQVFYGGPGKHLLPEYVVRMKILLVEAVKEKLADQPQVARAIQIARESILADAARKHIEEGISVSDQELRELYQKDKTLSEEVRVRHILIPTEAAPLKSGDPGHPALPEPEARKKLQDIRKRILAGADFAQMAKQYSEDTATAASGGDMGVIQRDRVVPPIVNAANSLEPGQVSDIILTPYGVEIIKVEGKRTRPFEEVKPRLESELRQSKAKDAIAHLAEQYKVVIDQGFFSSQQPAMSAAPASPPTH